MNIADILKVQQAARAEHPAMECGDALITYGELAVLVDRCAARMRKQGIHGGDVLAINLPDCIEYLVVLYGLAKIGAIAFPVAGTSPAPEQKRLLEQSGARHLIAAAGPSPLKSVPVLALSGLCTIDSGIDPAAAEKVSTAGFDANTPLIIISSSGTSAAAKFLLLTHAQMHWRITTRERNIGFAPTDRYLSAIKLSFNLARLRCMRAIQSGATIVFPGPDAGETLVDLVHSSDITITNLLPTQVRRLADRNRGKGPLLPGVRVVIGSSPVSAQDRRRLRRRITPHLYEVYAATETGPIAVAAPADQDARPQSVGMLAEGVEAQVVDANDVPLAAGEVGHIRFRTPNLPTAYLDNPEASAKAFRGGWFYPGDMASISADGYVFLKGRDDDVINNEGAKFYPREVEEVLMTHPAVVEAAVIGWPHRKVGEAAVACVVVKKKVPATMLKEFCRQRIPGFKVPFAVLILNKLPKNESGKVLKRELKPIIQRRLQT